MNQQRFEDYLVNTLNESLMKKSKSNEIYFLTFCFWDRRYQANKVRIMVDWK